MGATTQKGQALVTPQQLSQYKEEGYTLVRNLIPPVELEPLKRQMLAFEAGERGDWPENQFHTMEAIKDAKGKRLIGGVQLPAKHSEDFRKVADHANLQAAMAQILGGPIVRYTDQCAVKSHMVKTEMGSCTFFHQDTSYWELDPELGCNCWIPFQDVDRDSIALAIMPRSHAGWKLIEHERYFDDPPPFSGDSAEPFKRRRIPLDKIDFSKEVLIPMRAGDGLFFTNYTWHRSEKNKTGRTMMYYAIAYNRADKKVTKK
jgi:ectoine hydroxylase-related dioxygenase (phytanoyl-CoA dioxygenase family)